jgi:membrane protease YdiL (CAAX protease family)
MMNVLVYICLPPEWLQHFTYLVIHAVYLGAVIQLIKHENSDFQKCGFWWPENFGKYISVSALLAIAHFFITIFLPGSFMGFELLPPVSQASLEFMEILLTSIVSESIFRGYIQGNLTRIYGFLPALGITSLMFSLYGLQLASLLSFDLTFLVADIVSLVIMSVFLGFFFQKTMTLVCPVTFHGILLLSDRFTLLKAITTTYLALFFDVIAYVFLILLVYVLTKKKFWEP